MNLIGVIFVKRSVLPLKEDLLIRPRVEKIINESSEAPLTCLVAGSGYGKTQALASYAFNTSAVILWIQLTELDNFPEHLWGSIVNSAAVELPEVASIMASLEFPSTPNQVDALMEKTSELVNQHEKILIIMDECHNITNPEIIDFFYSFIFCASSNTSFIVVLNSMSDLMLMHNLSYEKNIIGDDVLRFNEEEIEALLAINDVPTSDEVVSAISKRTDGWPFAVHLTTLNLKQTPITRWEDIKLPQTDELFDDRYFIKYSIEIQNTLVRLSLLQGFTLETIRAIGGCDIREIYDVIKNNLFITFDHSAELYTFKRMYKDFLQKKAFLLSEEDIYQTRIKAGEWLVENGYYMQGTLCFIDAKDYERVVSSLQYLPSKRVGKGISDFVLNTLINLPDEYFNTHPNAKIKLGAVYINNVYIDKANDTFMSLEKELSKDLTDNKNSHNSELLGEVYTFLLELSLIQNTEDFAKYAKLAAELLPNGSIYHKKVDIRTVDNNSAFFLAHDGDSALEEIIELMTSSVPYFKSILHGIGEGMVLLFCAEAAYLTYDFSKSRELCYRAIYKGREMRQHDIVCNSHFVLLRIALLHGEYENAANELEEIKAYITDNECADLYELYDCVSAWLYLALETPDMVNSWIADGTEQKDQPPISQGRNFVMRAIYLCKTAQFYEAIALFDQLKGYYSNRGLWTAKLYLYIYNAIALLRAGDKDRAISCLYAAYEKSYKNGIITPFVEGGSAMRTLIENARKSDYDFDETWLNTIYQKASTYAKYVSSMAKKHFSNTSLTRNGITLTKRELEVLKCLSKGLTRDEIGDFLGISINAVKNHIKGIYSKLGAVNRADAIYIATQNGILE